MSNLFTAVSAEQQEIVAGGKITLKDLQINVISGEQNSGINGGAVIVKDSLNSYTDSFNDVKKFFSKKR
ncbi:hypothetical protein [Dolichospermum sp. LEGE 00246]|uniref:hypothetical protein n=1 Tax=Dolichospermum sp. LEGE 00246 TaxID=1828605 RepID=UPI00187E52AA|nr:hypothetical protein [Dolichospermum sp. LEGE 00246]MBE9260068.1 hypothetical protein [Dolichospermum sp. LEGE 00246]